MTSSYIGRNWTVEIDNGMESVWTTGSRAPMVVQMRPAECRVQFERLTLTEAMALIKQYDPEWDQATPVGDAPPISGLNRFAGLDYE